MIKSTISRKWRGKQLKKGEAIEGATPIQKDAMLACGQAYCEDEVSMRNSKEEIQDYLTERGLEYSENNTKEELLNKL